MKHDKGVWGTAMVFAIAAFVAGCATGALDYSSQWWSASVVDVVRASQIPPGADRTCVPAKKANTARGESTVAIVRYRVGRAPVSMAFVMPGQESFLAGDRVLVQPDSCRIKRDLRSTRNDIEPWNYTLLPSPTRT